MYPTTIPTARRSRGLPHGCLRCDARNRCQYTDRRFADVVQMPLSALDERVSRHLEPGICPAARRIEVLKALRRAGVPTVVQLRPILPWLNDTPENIRGIVEACADAGVAGILSYGMGQPQTTHYYSSADLCSPGLWERHIRTRASAYELRSPHSREMEDLFHRLCQTHGILHDNGRIYDWMAHREEPRQQEAI